MQSHVQSPPGPSAPDPPALCDAGGDDTEAVRVGLWGHMRDMFGDTLRTDSFSFFFWSFQVGGACRKSVLCGGGGHVLGSLKG